MADQNEIQAELADDVQPFTMLQNAFLDDAALSANAFRVFIILKSYTSGRAKTKQAFPSYATLKARCNIGANATLARAIRELEAAKWITRTKRFGRSSLYTLRAIKSVSDIVNTVSIKSETDQSVSQKLTHSKSETDHYQEVQKQEVLQQEVEQRRRAADAAVAKAGIANSTSQKILKSRAKKLAAPSPFDLGDLENSPAIRAHRRVCGNRPMTVEQATFIDSQVNGTAETTWPDDLLKWTKGVRKSDGEPYRLDAYEKQVQFHLDAEVRRRNGAGKSSAPAFTPEQLAEIEAKIGATL